MGAGNPTVLITGVAGDLGVRLLPLLADFQVIGVDLNPPSTSLPLRFVQLDLAKEESCRQLYLLLKEARVAAVIHLAFVIDPVKAGGLDLDQMWQINVAGTARVMEAITEANRDEVIVQKFVFPSSVSVYGSDLASPATETTPLAAHTLPYALHKMECDKVVQQRAPALRGCSVFMLRPHIFAGASVNNYFLGAIRGTPIGRSKRAANMREQGKRLPCLLPYGKRYLANRMQFVHVDDMARLIEHILRRTEPESQRLTILNVAGRGEPLPLEQCIQMARAELFRVPGTGAFRMVLTVLSKLGISAIPPQALPYITGEYLMNTDRLQSFLGSHYTKVIHYTIADAFADSFHADMGSERQKISAATTE
jgi:UDP-glucose 4-epimerase